MLESAEGEPSFSQGVTEFIESIRDDFSPQERGIFLLRQLQNLAPREIDGLRISNRDLVILLFLARMGEADAIMRGELRTAESFKRAQCAYSLNLHPEDPAEVEWARKISGLPFRNLSE